MIRTWFITLCLCITTLVSATPITERSLDQARVRELVAVFGGDANGDLITETQRLWKRPKGSERWQMAPMLADKHDLVLNWACQQGLYEPWKPARAYYDKAVILGATTGQMQLRLDYLKSLWEEGVRFDEVVWLTGDRPLAPDVDSLLDIAQNESEAAHIIWMQMDMPSEMKALPVRFIATAMYEVDGKPKRPNTMDTLVTWLQTAEPCSALFVSTQPFCGYQYAVLNTALPESFDFDVVGGVGGDPHKHPLAAGITLDAVARWLYQEAQ